MSNRMQDTKLIEKEKVLKHNLEKWVMIEENVYKQKSRVQWLKLGDSNSGYFFAQMKHRNNTNRIQMLTDDMERQLVLDDEIEAEILGYYRKLLGSKDDSIPAINPNVIKMGTILSREQQMQLIKQVTKEEIGEVLEEINDQKALGYDGFNAIFFKRAWGSIGEEVTQAVKEFFDIAQMYKPVNCISITLIPKVKSPTSIKEFSPYHDAQ
ncbi:uncharacterized protein LOC107803069 [Nicotiana tabacum]|uniref:Uncharacterized protein LOC107803069 n=2 Tax=Nicotiana TaxID=4085 RepID=A0A1S4AZN7_TOBAC|nr:PREDICTED: uncharacterized protein LOC104223065 [Nicotiana sylvestris]XP_016482155.1 PREDICTED: uncharacterized protein LOC107803069 [Nicotiana tabacum]